MAEVESISKTVVSVYEKTKSERRVVIPIVSYHHQISRLSAFISEQSHLSFVDVNKSCLLSGITLICAVPT
jgi:hypothetical protein